MKYIYTLLLSFFVITLATGQDQNSVKAKKITIKDVYVIDAYKKEQLTKSKKRIRKREQIVSAIDTLDFGDTLVVKLENIDVLIDSGDIKLDDIVLYINEYALTSLIPIQCCRGKNEVYFVLYQRIMSQDEKNYIKKLPGLFTKEIGVGVQIGDNDAIYKCDKTIFISLRSMRTEYIASCIFAVILSIILLFLCKKSSLIRDNSDQPLAQRTYSLSRLQLAWWTFIIIVSYLFIYLVTGDTDLLNLTAVTLLGISAGTTAIGVTIDKSDSAEGRVLHQNDATKGWLLDVLSDKNGVSIHRLQTLIFNLIFGFIFIRYVLGNFTMPEFSTNQLILLGVSAGTYTFVKSSENNGSQAGSGDETKG